jgi:hypothetical protein
MLCLPFHKQLFLSFVSLSSYHFGSIAEQVKTVWMFQTEIFSSFYFFIFFRIVSYNSSPMACDLLKMLYTEEVLANKTYPETCRWE